MTAALSPGRSAVWVAAGSAAWVVISVVVGAAAAYLPVRLLARDTVVTRIRSWEAGGRPYRRLGVHRWKALLPEVNGLGPGQRPSKAVLGGRQGVEPLLRETRRAEYVHLAVAVAGLSFPLWMPAPLGFVMLAGGVAFNLPFVLVQRYNRARLLRVLAAGDAAARRREVLR
ncbi:MAG: hypothetical protein AB7W59_25950 [Acidimicrobiia bacterium]